MTNGHPRLAVHRTVLAVDVEKYGDPGRTDRDRLAVRAGLYSALRQAFQRAEVPWSSCYHDDCGDGVLVLVPPEVPKGVFAGPLLIELANALRAHNSGTRCHNGSGCGWSCMPARSTTTSTASRGRR